MPKITLFAVLGCAALMAADTFTQQQRQFWSFQKVQPQTPPAIKNVARARNPVNRLILAKIETDVPVAGLLIHLKARGILERPVHVHDLHATILWRPSLDHVKVTYLQNGRSERPTIISGKVIRDVLA